MKYHERIGLVAKEKGIKLSFISVSLGKNRAYISDYLKHEYTIPEDLLEKIAELLGVSYNYLVGETDEEKENAPVKLDRRTKRVIEIYDSLPDDQKRIFDSLLDQFAQLSALSNKDTDTDD